MAGTQNTRASATSVHTSTSTNHNRPAVMLSCGAEELVGQQQIGRGVVVGHQQCDRNPDHRWHRDPRDRVAQVPHSVHPGNRREAEPAEVVARDAQQQMCAAPQLEQPGVRTDDEHDRRRRAAPRWSPASHPTTAIASAPLWAWPPSSPQWQPLPVCGQLAERAFQPNRHGHIGQRIAAKVDKAGVGIDTCPRRSAARRRTARAGRSRWVRRCRRFARQLAHGLVVGLARREHRQLGDGHGLHGADGDTAAAAATRWISLSSCPAAATARRSSSSVQNAVTPSARMAASTRCRSIRSPYILTKRLLRPINSYSPSGGAGRCRRYAACRPSCRARGRRARARSPS